MGLEGWINILFTFILVVCNVIVAYFNYRNIKLTRELSSPKPFLKPTGYMMHGIDEPPTINIKNCGHGHAVNVKVKVTVNAMDQNGNLYKDVWVDYEGSNTIPFVQENEKDENVARYRYNRNKNERYVTVQYVENFKVKIEYESDSGAKGYSVWQFNKEKEKGFFELIEGR